MKNPVKFEMVNKAYYNTAEDLSRSSVSLNNLFCFEKCHSYVSALYVATYLVGPHQD